MKVLITGSNGQLGSEIRELASEYENLECIFKDLPELDICDTETLTTIITDQHINAVINCAGYTAVDKAEEEELSAIGGGDTVAANAANVAQDQTDEPTVQPFAGLPELPDDVADAFEALKLAVLRHKTAGWSETDAESVQKYLDAFTILMR